MIEVTETDLAVRLALEEGLVASPVVRVPLQEAIVSERVPPFSIEERLRVGHLNGRKPRWAAEMDEHTLGALRSQPRAAFRIISQARGVAIPVEAPVLGDPSHTPSEAGHPQAFNVSRPRESHLQRLGLLPRDSQDLTHRLEIHGTRNRRPGRGSISNARVVGVMGDKPLDEA